VSVDLYNTDWPPLGTPKGQDTSPGSPMKTSPVKNDGSPMAFEVSERGKMGTVITPTSGPISQNPLLVKIPRFNKSPNTKWLHTQGLIPVRNGLLAPGYIPEINADHSLCAPGQACPKAPSMSCTDICNKASAWHGTSRAQHCSQLWQHICSE
jgi:hypothetical protein